ncbi:MAG: serine hydrolase [Burkholderiales bacterium]|nr:serine hydrolase [Burkholderiales bacterium]
MLKLFGAGGALASLGLLSACGGSNEIPALTEAIAPDLFAFTPENQAATYRHVDKLGPTRLIRRGAAVAPLPAHQLNLGAMKYDFGGSSNTIDDYMQRNRSGGLLILKNGKVALERYGMGNDAASRWTSFSVAKSLTSTLIGAALQDGRVASLDDKVSKYVRQLQGSAYEQNSIRDLLRMSSGVRWNEEYSNSPDSDIARLLQAVRSGEPGAVMALMRTRPRAAEAGSVFNYSTGESYVLGAVVAGATGMNLSDYLSQKIWAPLGMEADGYWLLDAQNGLEMGGDNFSATLRDYARFGQFFLRQGVIDGRRVLPDGWRDLAGQPDTGVTACGQLYPAYPLGYGYQWWSFPAGEAALPMHDAAFTAEGIFGQFIYINPKEDVVAVVWSAWPEAWVDKAEMETYTLIGTAVAMLA